MLRGRGIIEGRDELTHGFAGMARRLIHLRVIILYLEHVRLALRSDRCSSERMLRFLGHAATDCTEQR